MKTAKPKKSLLAKKRVYMGELCRIINREPNTIRMWDRYGTLPDHLKPKRGDNGWRYWTHSQVFGKDGIIKWMEREDMRPGKTLTDPADEERHLKNLRKPRNLTKKQLREIDQMVRSGYSRTEIIMAMYPRTTYNRPEGFEFSLVRYYKGNDMYFPPKIRIKREKLSEEVKAELVKIEKQVNKRLQKAIK